MVARRMRRHSALRRSFVEGEDGVGRAAGLERAHLLEIFALKKERSAGSRIETRAGQDRRPMNVRTDAFVRSENGGVIERHLGDLQAWPIFLAKKIADRQTLLHRFQFLDEFDEAPRENGAAHG